MINLVDIKWIVTVIVKVRLSPKMLMTPRLPPPAHRRRRRTPWRTDTNYRRQGVWEEELPIGRKQRRR